MEQCALELAEHFLGVTKYIYKDRGFCFSTAFIIGEKVEVVRLDVSTEEKKESYANLVKSRFYETGATYLIVIQQACVTRLSPFELSELMAEPPCEDGLAEDGDTGEEALVVFISSRTASEVWQIPLSRGEDGLVFGDKEVLKTIVSENWMVNQNKELALQLN
jgi:hypothetical protein